MARPPGRRRTDDPPDDPRRILCGRSNCCEDAYREGVDVTVVDAAEEPIDFATQIGDHSIQ